MLTGNCALFFNRSKWPGSCFSRCKLDRPLLHLPCNRGFRCPSRTTTELFAVILGTNEIASVIGIQLVRAGHCVVLSHDPDPPVIRRKMAFHDALFTDTVQLEDLVAERVDDGVQVHQALGRAPQIMVTWLGLLDLLPVRHIDLLIDARLQKRRITPDLRRLARLTSGSAPASRRISIAMSRWRPGPAGSGS